MDEVEVLCEKLAQSENLAQTLKTEVSKLSTQNITNLGRILKNEWIRIELRKMISSNLNVIICQINCFKTLNCFYFLCFPGLRKIAFTHSSRLSSYLKIKTSLGKLQRILIIGKRNSHQVSNNLSLP